MIKRIRSIVIYPFIAAYLVIALGFTMRRSEEKLCTGLNIVLNDSINSCFLGKEDIENFILSENTEMLGYPVHRINIREIERMRLCR